MVAKRLRSIARMNVGVHNDVDLQAPSPYKAFLSPKNRLGFIVSTCLSFKHIHKNSHVSNPRIRIYKDFYALCYRFSIFILTYWQECRAWSSWPNVFTDSNSKLVFYSKSLLFAVHKEKAFNTQFLISYSHISELLRNNYVIPFLFQ